MVWQIISRKKVSENEEQVLDGGWEGGEWFWGGGGSLSYMRRGIVTLVTFV